MFKSIKKKQFNLDILLLMRRLVHEGTPLHTIGFAVLRDICLRIEALDTLTESKKEWICRLLKIGKWGKDIHNFFLASYHFRILIT